MVSILSAYSHTSGFCAFPKGIALKLGLPDTIHWIISWLFSRYDFNNPVDRYKWIKDHGLDPNEYMLITKQEMLFTRTKCDLLDTITKDYEETKNDN